MQFGARVKLLGEQLQWTQKKLAERLDVSVSYISKVENERLHFGDYPSETFIHKLADELQVDEDELLLLADKVPEGIRERTKQRPNAFRQFEELDDRTMDAVLVSMNRQNRKKIAQAIM